MTKRTYQRQQIISVAEAFAQLEQAAIADIRCPIAGTNGLTSGLTSKLTRSGHIRIDVYPHNWRVVTILVGPHAGKSTAGPPNKNWRPYRTIEKGTETISYRRISP